MSSKSLVSLPEHWRAFVEAEVAAGHYADESQVIQAGLRLLEAEQAQLDQLREALIEAEQSGAAREFDNAAFIARMKAEKRV